MAITGEEVAEIRRRTKLNGDDFAAKLGVETWVIRNIENNRKAVEPELEEKIRELALELPLRRFKDVSLRRPALPEMPPDLVPVEFWNQPVEGGDGAAQEEREQVVEYLAFSRVWLNGAAPSGHTASVKAVRVRRDSMAPAIAHGDVILVDIAWRTPQSGQIYVIRRETGLVVKELVKDGNRWKAISRNEADKDKAFYVKLEEGEDTIAGRVFWRCGKV